MEHATVTSVTLGTVQMNPATPTVLYSRTSGRCVCDATVKLRLDGQWTHGAVQGIYCREERISCECGKKYIRVRGQVFCDSCTNAMEWM